MAALRRYSGRQTRSYGQLALAMAASASPGLSAGQMLESVALGWCLAIGLIALVARLTGYGGGLLAQTLAC